MRRDRPGGAGGAGNVGAVMKTLKVSHEGRYDGTVASHLGREMLASNPVIRFLGKEWSNRRRPDLRTDWTETVFSSSLRSG